MLQENQKDFGHPLSIRRALALVSTYHHFPAEFSFVAFFNTVNVLPRIDFLGNSVNRPILDTKPTYNLPYLIL